MVDGLEVQADRLLAPFKGVQLGIYEESHLSDRMERDRRLNPPISDELDALISDRIVTDLHRMGNNAGLTDQQRLIWDLFCDGHTQSDIADVFGIEQQAVQQCLSRCRRTVERYMEHDRYYGLWQVYYELINRPCKRALRH